MNKFDLNRKKTYTSRWNNFSQAPKKKKNYLKYLKIIKQYLSQFFGFKLSIKITKNIKKYDVSFTSYQIDNCIIDYRNLELLKIVKNYIMLFNLESSDVILKKIIEDYISVFYKSPVKELGSGFGFNEGLFLFCIIRIIKPDLIIESGVMKGFTTYLIDAASSNDCDIKCYDINFENLEYKSNKASYFNHDISSNKPNLQNKKVLAFWDDHTSQLDRLVFSINEGIKYNFFDDDLSFLNFHSDGWPPIPTISMLEELKNNIINKEQVNWICRNKKGEIWLDFCKDSNPINQVIFHKIFPNLFEKTGYKNHSQCSFLITK